MLSRPTCFLTALNVTPQAATRFAAIPFAAGFLLLCVATSPAAQAASAGDHIVRAVEDSDDSTRLRVAVLEVFTGMWFFVLGSVIGSFLNVVIHRLPRGMSLRHPPSRCPSCHHRIRRRDNLPIVGWLLLRGRCRNCRCPIPARYPLVEAATGLIFLSLLVVELLSGGANLPLRRPNLYTGVVWIIWSPQWDLLGIYAYHCVLLCALLCVALTAWDVFAPPRRLVLPVLLGGLLLPVVWSGLHPVPLSVPVPEWLSEWSRWLAWQPQQFPLDQIPIRLDPTASLTGLAGLGMGLTMGAAAVLCIPRGVRKDVERRSVVAAFALSGSFLGWQATVSLGAIAFLILLAAAVVAMIYRSASVPPAAAAVGVATYAQILFWKRLTTVPWWPTHRMDRLGMAIAVAAIILAAVTLRLIARRRSASAETPPANPQQLQQTSTQPPAQAGPSADSQSSR